MQMKLLLENWRKFVAQEAQLSKGRFQKPGYSWTLELFLLKTDNNSPFETKDGDIVFIDPNDKFIQAIRELANKGFGNKEIEELFSQEEFSKKAISLRACKDSSWQNGSCESIITIPLSSIKKTQDIGGEDPQKRLGKENKAIGQLQEIINDAISTSQKGSITIHLELKNTQKDEEGKATTTSTIVETFTGVTGVEKQGKVVGVDPKSDFNLIGKDGKKLAYISHKDGNSPASFGQWSGVTFKAGKTISKHPEVLSFIQSLKDSKFVVNGELVRGMTVGREIKDPNLKLLSIFGNKSVKKGKLSQGSGNAENVDIVAQGTFSLEPANQTDEYILRADHMLVRKNFASDFGEGYQPVLAARWTSDGRANAGIAFARIGIYPIKGRLIRDDAWI
jgi:hypothetical protein